MASEVFKAGEMTANPVNAVAGSANRDGGRAFVARVSRGMSNERIDELHTRLGGSFAHPVYEWEAQDYKASTGHSLPNDAVRIVFGRGAANGEDFRSVLSQSDYSHMKVHESRSGSDYRTYLSGYRGTDEQKRFISDVKHAQQNNKLNRLQRTWSRRSGSNDGL